MSSILDIDGSSDENDGDYVPPNVLPSDSSGAEDDGSCDDLEPDQKPKSRRGKRRTKEPEPEIIPPKPPVDEKKRADDIWSDFLSDVSKSAPAKTIPKVPTTVDVAKSDTTKPTNKLENGSKSEIFEFAGETFTVSKESKISLDSSSRLSVDTPSATKSEAPVNAQSVVPKKRSGLESVLGGINNKKKKLSTLEKSLYDWKSFKQDEGLDEDLEKYNKGKGGFIERQRFLQRSDVRSFEIEKSMRQSKRKT